MTNTDKTLTNVNKRITHKQKHNDRNFTSETDKHINASMSVENVYWNCFEGVYMDIDKSSKMTFEEVERKHYEEYYKEALDITNDNYIKARHKERCKTIDDLLKGSKTAPMETLIYIGDKETTTDATTLYNICVDYVDKMKKYENLCMLDMALHIDEATPHIHLRFIVDYEDEKGVLHINQNKGLEQMGIELPEPEKKITQNNNRLKTMTKIMRDTLIDICKDYNINIVKSDRMGGQSLEDYKRDKEIEKRTKEQRSKEEELHKQKIEEMQKEIYGYQNQIDELVKDLDALEITKDIEEKEHQLKLARIKAELSSKTRQLAEVSSKLADYGNFFDMSYYDEKQKQQKQGYNIEKTR